VLLRASQRRAKGAAVFGLVMALIAMVLMVFVFGLQVSYPFSLFVSLVISRFAFAFLGILISVGVREVFEAMTLSNFVRFPMIFLCGVFFPITSMPTALQVIGFCLPLTYSVDALRQSLLSHGGVIHRWLDILILAGFSLVIFEISLAIFRKRTQESN
jgi:ABC-2 type transport system permease protein